MDFSSDDPKGTADQPRVIRSGQVPITPANDGAEILDATLVALSDSGGAFDVRLVTIGPQTASTTHEHPWPQANYIVSGTCTVIAGDVRHTLEAGDAVWLPGGIRHGFTNEHDTPVVTLCVRGGS